MKIKSNNSFNYIENGINNTPVKLDDFIKLHNLETVISYDSTNNNYLYYINNSTIKYDNKEFEVAGRGGSIEEAVANYIFTLNSLGNYRSVVRIKKGTDQENLISVPIFTL